MRTCHVEAQSRGGTDLQCTYVLEFSPFLHLRSLGGKASLFPWSEGVWRDRRVGNIWDFVSQLG